MSNNIIAHPTNVVCPIDVANDINAYTLENPSNSGRSKRIPEPEVDTTLCGRDGSLRERRCKLFKLTMLAIVPGIIITVRDALKVASDIQVFLKLFFDSNVVWFSIHVGCELPSFLCIIFEIRLLFFHFGISLPHS